MAAMLISAQAVDYDGAVLSGAKLNVYDAGTTTPRAIYASKELASGASSANPAVATATGGIAVWVNDSAGDIKVTLTNSAGTTTYYSQDNIDPTNGNLVVFPLGGQDQTLATTDSVAFAGLTLSGNLDMQGNRIVLDADNDSYIAVNSDDSVSIFIGGTEVIKLDASASDVFTLDGVSLSPTGAVVGQALGYPNSATTVEPYTPAGGGDTLAAANETISGDWEFTGSPDLSGVGNAATIRDDLGIYQVDNIAAMTALTESELADGDQCEVAHYFTDGDGGGGLFRWDASSTETADAGWHFAPDTSDGTGRWVRVDRTTVNVRHFGAQGDGVEDAAEATALTAAYGKWVSLMGSQGAQYPSASQRALVIPPGDYFPNSVLTWTPQGTGARIICLGVLREVQINPQGNRQSFTGLHLVGTADETSAATYGILLDNALSDESHFQDFVIRDRPTGLRIAATNAGNNHFVNGNIRDCTAYGIHADAGASNNFTNVASDGNAKNLFLDGGDGSGEFKFVNCRFGNTLAAGDDKSAHIVGSTGSDAVESYFTQCTFTASRNDGRQLSITGVTDAGGGKIEITTSTEHKLFDGWDDTFSISGTTSYNGTFDASNDGLTVTGATTFQMTATYVATETGTLNLPPWDLYIESDTTGDISDVNDMFFQGGNINHCFIKSALKVQFIGTRLKQSIFMESDDAANKKGVHRVLIVGDARGRAQNPLADVPVAGATAGWVRIGTKDDTASKTPAATKFVVETPDTSASLGSDNLPVTQKIELTGGAFRFLTGSTVNFEVSDDGDITGLPFIATASAGTANKIEVVSNASGSSPLIRPYSDVDTNVDLRLDSKGTGDIDVRPGGYRALLCNYVASAVNYLVINPATGSTVNMLADGSAADISVDFRSKGSGTMALRAGGGTRQVQVNNTGCAFFGVSPVAQPSTTGTATGFTAGSGTSANDDSTYTGGTGSAAYTVGDIVLALKQLGLLSS